MEKLVSYIRSAVSKYDMIEDGDNIAVGVSGGKDSLVLLCGLSHLSKFYNKKFSITALTADPRINGKDMDLSQISELCRRLKIPYYIRRTELSDIIFNKRNEKNPCSLCARMRRGILHDMAIDAGCNKIALGHHFDDAIQTFYMNLFNCGTISCFSPKTYLSRKDLYMIRPMIYCRETMIQSVADRYNLPVVKSECPVDGKTERKLIEDIIKNLEKTYPDLKNKTLGAMERGNISNWVDK